jgi:hypothetical protein
MFRAEDSKKSVMDVGKNMQQKAKRRKISLAPKEILYKFTLCVLIYQNQNVFLRPGFEKGDVHMVQAVVPDMIEGTAALRN